MPLLHLVAVQREKEGTYEQIAHYTWLAWGLLSYMASMGTIMDPNKGGQYYWKEIST